MLIKVCGMREPENIRAVAALPVDWMGFIFYPKSPRFIAPDEADVETIRRCPRKKVGVFVNAPLEQMLEIVGRLGLDYLQLHGSESPDTCYALQKRGLVVIKAFSIATEEDLKAVEAYEGRTDYFLFDTKTPAYGGSGKQFDWKVLHAYTGQTPFLLSGGLHAGSAEALLAFHHPRLAGIDLNSGFETSPAQKDVRLLTAFITEYNKKREI